MKKVTEVTEQELIYSQGGLKKYSTNKKNTFVYYVQIGWGFAQSILKNLKNKRDETYKEKVIIYTYSDYVNNQICGQLIDVDSNF